MLSHLPHPKLLRLFAGAACLAVSGAAGAIVARPPEPIPPPAPRAAPVAISAPAPAADPIPVAARSAHPKAVAVSELTLARSVLAALDADPVLKDVNLVVSVVERGAVVGGPVTSEDVRKRVEVVVRGVPGVESVKNVCFVTTDGDPLLRAMAERLKPGTRPTSPPPLPGVALAPTVPAGYLPPVPPDPESELLAGIQRSNKVDAQYVPLPPSVLGAPVAPAEPGATSRPAPPAAPAPGALTGSTAPAQPPDLPTAARAAARAEPRFARFTVELKPDGALFVSGASANTSDVRDFVTELRKLPGAGRIVVDPALVR